MIGKRLGLKKRTVVIVGSVALVCVVALAVGLGLSFGLKDKDSDDESQRAEGEKCPFTKAAVASNGAMCSTIGSQILEKNGSAVEAAIAALFCEGILCPQSMGIGGGFIMTIYDHKTKTVMALNSRETAPAAASDNMFNGNETLSQFGGLAVAVPGELRGYQAAFERYKSGNVEWADLLQPTIDICRAGFKVTGYLASKIKAAEKSIRMSPTLSEILVNPETNKLLKEGDLLKRTKMAETLEIMQKEPDALHDGSLTQAFVKDIQDLGGIVTVEDMKNYKPLWQDPVKVELKDGITMYTSPLPGSGVLLASMLNVLDDFIPTESDVATNQRIVESFKHAYGKRTRLGDPQFEVLGELVKELTSKEYAEAVRRNISDTQTSDDPGYYGAEVYMNDDHGTAHLSVLAPNGDAVSVTSTVNLLFGAKVRSLSTGIILNNEMDDFSAPNITNAFGVPPSPSNFIKPGKRPMSSMVPSIFVDKNGDVRLVTGAAGGTKITTATALVAIKVLWFNRTITQAIEDPRLHHQLFPNELEYETSFPKDIIEGLERIGHNITVMTDSPSTVTGITMGGGQVCAHSDSRRGGTVDGF